MKNRFIARSPQNLYLPPLDLPQAIAAILDQIYKVQARRRVRRVLRLERLVRPHMIRDRVCSHGCRVGAVLQLNADIAGDMRGDEDEDFAKEVADRGPALDGNWTGDNDHALVLQAGGLEEVTIVAVDAEDAAVESIGDGFAWTKGWKCDWVGHGVERGVLKDS